ncbi:unnamed protein product [Phyllotreta striolata]|uniref:Histone-lysine N-methyltransferase eggless n=1 Tax=Phyllotreta striolata TaxID=444603 RepID=A0A9N9TSS4_PHYSR|nr:unnamed protein product [Phyllotreta striolata]
MDSDDPMEIDDLTPNTVIIERKIDETGPAPANTGNLNPNIPSDSTSTDNKSNAESSNVVVLLDDDEENVQQNKGALPKSTSAPIKNETSASCQDIIDLVEKRNVRCLNSNCTSGDTNFFLASDFCLSFYRVKRSKSYKEEICQECYKAAVDVFDDLTTTLKSGNSITECPYPIINETVQIEDSDEEEEIDEKEKEYLDPENFKFLKENIDSIFDEVLARYDINEQWNMAIKYLGEQACELTEETDKLTGEMSEIRNGLDKIQMDLYNHFRPEYNNITPISIVDDCNFQHILIDNTDSFDASQRKSRRSHKPVSYIELDEPSNSNSPKVVNPTAEIEPPKDLPQIMPLVRTSPIIGEYYYIVRENTRSNWIRGRLQHVINPGTIYNGQMYTTVHYKLVELKQQKERIVTAKQMAFWEPSKVSLPVGTRVISAFKETGISPNVKKPKLDPYYAGVVAEQPFEGNRYRYLIFFDIGYSQYVSYNNVNLVLDSSQNVWEDIYEDSKSFIKKYLESQDRPMVKLAKNQTVRVEYSGKWWLCTVNDVDCSLVQVIFETLQRMEWIYRGSTRLSPMFKEEQAATNRSTGVRTSRKLRPNESQTVVQYQRKDDFISSNENQDSPTNVRAVARKSTTRPQANMQIEGAVPFLPQVKEPFVNATGPTSKIMYFTPRDQVIIRRQYKPHTCGPKCREFLTHDFHQLRGQNPLSKPLLCGWGRITGKAKGRKEILYKAPCGRILRNIAEVHYYLRITNSEMTVDLFDFNHTVRCLAEFSVDCNPDPKDLSRGTEQVPIPVINGINNEMLDFCNYSIKRVPMEGVHMNLDKEFLCGCDCEDDCIDKTKCSCWKLTLEGAKYIGKDIDPNSVGYIYRRLPEQVITGIYECNSRCKCTATCLNRVVQNPMNLKLQVFRTLTRGWGIRCLNDVPQGTFICIYAGTIHTEAMANEDGMAYGDEYFAELDYIETVEKFKEDYEAEAIEDDEDEEEKRRAQRKIEEDEDDSMLRKTGGSGKKRNSYSDDNDFTPSHPGRHPTSESRITTRLRRRNQEDDKANNENDNKKPEADVKIKKEIIEDKSELKSTFKGFPDCTETVTISDEEDEGREVLSFNPKASEPDEKGPAQISLRELFGEEESVYVMDAKNAGNIGRFLNHSCSPNVFVQNVFVDTHDPRFPWVSFFSSQFIRAGTELTWNYNYDIGSVPGRVLYCHCSSLECKGRLL